MTHEYDDDNPEWTEEDFRRARKLAVDRPDIVEAMKRGPGRPVSEETKVQISIRLDADIVEHFRHGGRGWQSRINEILREHVGGRI